MSGFENLNTDFCQTRYSMDDQSQQSYDYGGSGGPYSNPIQMEQNRFMGRTCPTGMSLDF